MPKSFELKTYQFKIKDIEIEVHRKPIKNINLRICRETLKVTLSVPTHLPNQEIERFLSQKKAWLENKLVMLNASKPVKHPIADGKLLYYFGKPYHLQLFEKKTHKKCSIQKNDEQSILEMTLPLMSSQAFCQQHIDIWTKEQLRQVLDKLIAKWQKKTQQTVMHWQIRNMKTRWGSCTPQTRRLSFNLKLIHYPMACIEMVVVHEFIHFFEPSHNDNFKRLMTYYLPNWRDLDKFMRTQQLGGIHESIL